MFIHLKIRLLLYITTNIITTKYDYVFIYIIHRKLQFCDRILELKFEFGCDKREKEREGMKNYEKILFSRLKFFFSILNK